MGSLYPADWMPPNVVRERLVALAVNVMASVRIEHGLVVEREDDGDVEGAEYHLAAARELLAEIDALLTAGEFLARWEAE